MPDDRYMRTLDPWVSLAMAAEATSTIRLGTAVSLPVESDPITLAKTIASLDHLSGGRVNWGVGFGWNTDELADHGVPANRRRTVLREYVEAMRSPWTEQQGSYDGEFVSFGASWAWPKPAQARVPLLIGADAGPKTFAWIARTADGWMTTPNSTEIPTRVKELRVAWEAAERTGEPQVHVLSREEPDDDVLKSWEEAGVSDVMWSMPDRSVDEVKAFIATRAKRLGLG